MLTLSIGSASCSEDEPIQGTGQQVIPGNGSGSGDNGSIEELLLYSISYL